MFDKENNDSANQDGVVLSSDDCKKILGEIFESHEKHIANLNDNDFEINKPQMKKLLDLIELFDNESNEEWGDSIEIEPVTIEPRRRNVNVIIRLVDFAIMGWDPKRREKMQILKNSIDLDADFCISTLLNGKTEIDFCIPNVYIPKTKKMK